LPLHKYLLTKDVLIVAFISYLVKTTTNDFSLQNSNIHGKWTLDWHTN